MSRFERGFNLIKNSALRKQNGLQNCIPLPFERYSEFIYGIEPKKTTLITANSKVGKTQITDFMYLYYPIWYTFFHETNFKVKVLYFSLEMSEEQKIIQAISHFLRRLHNVKISSKELRSLKDPVPQEIVDKIDKMRPFLDHFFDRVEYFDKTRNRYGIWLEIFNYAEQNGKIEYEEKLFNDKKVKVIKSYTPYDPDLITIIITDHVGLLTPENGDDKMKTIAKFSCEDMVRARNLFGFNPVLVQQQMNSQESLENKKFDALMPTTAGLADSKDTQRDADLILGLFNPSKHQINNFKGYDITKLGNNFRSLEILADREGDSNQLCPLYFEGECSFFTELPKTTDKTLIQYYK
jgi:hypothetical protein